MAVGVNCLLAYPRTACEGREQGEHRGFKRMALPETRFSHQRLSSLRVCHDRIPMRCLTVSHRVTMTAKTCPDFSVGLPSVQLLSRPKRVQLPRRSPENGLVAKEARQLKTL